MLSVSPCSQSTGGNNPALIGQQIIEIKQAFSVSTLVRAKKNQNVSKCTERGICHQPLWRKSTPIYQDTERAVPHSWMANSGYLITGRTQFVGIYGFFCKETGASLRAPSELCSAKPWEILLSTLWQGPGHNSGLAPFKFSPEITSSQGFSLKCRGKDGEFQCLFKPRTPSPTPASAFHLPRRKCPCPPGWSREQALPFTDLFVIYHWGN